MGQPRVRGPALGIEGERGDASQDLEPREVSSPVKVERVADGRVVPLGHRGPGELAGESALAGAPA